MKIGFTADSNIESGLSEVLYSFGTRLEDDFVQKSYGDSRLEIFVVLMCRDPRWNFKQRIRFDRKDNCLYMDLMLDLPTMTQADFEGRKRIVAEKIVSEVPAIIAKYKMKDFDLARFSSDLKSWFETNNWLG
jgi:hypothetical protein